MTVRTVVRVVDGYRRAFLEDTITGAMAGPYRTLYAAEAALARLLTCSGPNERTNR